MKIEQHILIRDLFVCVCFQSAGHINIHPNTGKGALSEAVYVKHGSSVQKVNDELIEWSSGSLIDMLQYQNHELSYTAGPNGAAFVHFNTLRGEHTFTTELWSSNYDSNYTAETETFIFCVEGTFYSEGTQYQELGHIRLVKDASTDLKIPTGSSVVLVKRI